jgi:tetratricopeptide (TPR) repeat protein
MPIIDMASETKTFKIGDNAPQSRPTRRKTRSGCAGTTTASACSTPAIRGLRPRLRARRRAAPRLRRRLHQHGIVEISWEKYDDAKGNLAKALTLLPGDPRALYYRASSSATPARSRKPSPTCKPCWPKYPRAKDALRELGFSYYQQHDYTQARDTYQRLQAVDPDDLAAHYQLAILYRRLGDKAKAAIESAKFADQKDDPTATEYALAVPAQAP